MSARGERVKRWDVTQHGKIDPFSAQIFTKRVEDPDGPFVLFDDMAAELARLRYQVEKRETMERISGQRMADEINAMVQRGVLNSRSPAADAALDWADPDFERLDELARLREEREEARDIVRALCSEMWLGFALAVSEDVQKVIDKAGLFVEVPASPEVKAEWDTDTMQMLKWDVPTEPKGKEAER